MKRVHWVLASAILLAGAAALAAGGLSKRYKTWDKSPEAYFLTRDERAQWKKVRTDEEAQNFILDYKAKRGPDFQKMLDERIAAADKYFSAGETKGSETLRGKVIIVFGPPSGVDNDLSKKGKKADISSNTGAPPSIGDSGRSGSIALGSGGADPMGDAPPLPMATLSSPPAFPPPRVANSALVPWLAVALPPPRPFSIADGGPKRMAILPRRVSEPFVSPAERYLSAAATRSSSIFWKSGPRFAL